METKVEALQDNQVKVTVTVDAKDIDARIKKTYRDFATKYNFPGFRKGKAPRRIIDNALGADAAAASVTDDVVNELYPLAIDENNLFPVGRPSFQEDILVKEGQPFEFFAVVEVKPEFELDSYEPVEIEMPAEGATEAEVDEQIDALREHYQTLVDANAATKIKAGSIIDLNVKATDADGKEIEGLTQESFQYTIASGMLCEQFDEEIMGLKKGQDKSFSIDVPAEAGALLMGQAGKQVSFDVKVNVLKKQTLPEVTDEWAKDTLGFESVEDLRNAVSESIQQQKDQVLPRLKENLCMQQLAQRLQGEAPQAQVEDAESSLLQEFFTQLQNSGMTFDGYLAQQGLTTDQFKADVKAQAADTVKEDLALEAWARHAGIAVTDEDLTAEFKNSGVEDPEALEADWRKQGQLHILRASIIRSRAANDVMDTAKVTESKPEAEKPAKKAPAKKKAAKKDDAE